MTRLTTKTKKTNGTCCPRDGTSTLRPPSSTTSNPDSAPSTPVPIAWARPATARERLPRILFLGAPLWQGAEFHADLLLWQGFGLSNSFGLEAFPNADAYKAGSESPRFMFSHFFVRQTIGLGGEQEDVPDGQFTLPGKRDISRLTITAGKLNMAELFDQNTYNHDPHTQFMSWASTMLTWDYPADTIGYTTGLALELNQPNWAVRYGWFQLPSLPNGFTSDDRILMYPVEPGEITSDGNFWKEWGMITEVERRWRIEDHPGAIRLQAWVDHGLLASYNAATTLLVASPPPANTPPGAEITIPGAAFSYRSKYGFGVNWEQEIAKNVGTFGRARLARRRNGGGGIQRRRLDGPAGRERQRRRLAPSQRHLRSSRESGWRFVRPASFSEGGRHRHSERRRQLDLRLREVVGNVLRFWHRSGLSPGV